MANVKEYVQSVVNAIGAVNPNAGVSAINPTETYNKISLNTSLSVDEVNNILSKLTYFGTSPQKYYVYCQDDKNYICIVKLAENVFSINGSYFIPNGNTVGNTGTLYSKVLFMSISLGEDAPAGFYVDNISEFEKHFNFTNGLSSLDGNPVGQQNDLLKNLIYVSSNTINAQDVPNKIRELKVQVGSKQLLGTYDGSSVEVTEAGVVDIGAMLDEGKLPLEVNVNVQSGGEDTPNAYQEFINLKKTCREHFRGYKGDNADFLNDIDFTNVADMGYIFQNSYSITSVVLNNTFNCQKFDYAFQGCKALKSVLQIDASNAIDLCASFISCSSLESIDLKDTPKCTDLSYAFHGCSSIVSISGINANEITSTSGLQNIFTNCTNLTNLSMTNIKVNLQIGSGTTWGHLLTLDNLINIVKELVRYSQSTLTMGSANLEKIANVYVKFTDPTQTSILFNQKGDVVVCESTDEGAMLLSDYALLKNWTLA